jgi:hypothetical protein
MAKKSPSKANVAGKLTLHGVISKQRKNEWDYENGLIEDAVPSPNTRLL